MAGSKTNTSARTADKEKKDKCSVCDKEKKWYKHHGLKFKCMAYSCDCGSFTKSGEKIG